MKLVNSKKRRYFLSIIFFVIGAIISFIVVLTERDILSGLVHRILVFSFPVVMAGFAYFVAGYKQSKSNSIDV